ADQVLEASQVVAHVAAAEVAAVGVDELLPVAMAAAKIRLKYRVALRGEDLCRKVEPLGRTAVRAAMRIENKLVGRLGYFGRRNGPQAFELQPFILPADDARFGQPAVLEKGVGGRSQLGASLGTAGDGLRRLRIGGQNFAAARADIDPSRLCLQAVVERVDE